MQSVRNSMDGEFGPCLTLRVTESEPLDLGQCEMDFLKANCICKNFLALTMVKKSRGHLQTGA